MANIEVNVEQIVNNLGMNISFMQPVYEAIVNSLEANATRINIEFFEDSQCVMNGIAPKINGFIIEDNGDGFTDENIKSFQTLWTTHKLKYGCKGSGRFTWLTVFKNIDIESYISESNSIVKIPFSKDFGNDMVKKISSDSPIDKNKTIISFKNLSDRIYCCVGGKRIDRRENSNLLNIYNKILDNLMVKLFLLKDKNIEFNIKLKLNKSEMVINNNTIPSLNYVDFYIKPDFEIIEKIPFRLFYYFKQDEKNSKKVYLCANERIVKTLDDDSLGFSASLPDHGSFAMMLCSDYLNDNVSNSRNNLSGLEGLKQATLDKPLLLTTIIANTKIYMNKIILEKYENLKENNIHIIKKAIDKKPYLSKYIKSTKDLLISEDSLIKAAKKEFNIQKDKIQEKFVKLLRDVNVDAKDFIESLDEISEVALEELGEYIHYRQTLIKALDISKQTEKNEDYMHKIFMPMGTTINNEINTNDYTLNNLWLLDDKFMTYSYAASNTTIKKILDEIQEKDSKKFLENKRPDMVVFYNKEKTKDLVVIEFKGANASLGEKENSIAELPRNIQILKRNINNINTIWSYIITNIDEEFENSLTASEFRPLFVNDVNAKIYYRFYPNNNAHVYALDINAIVSDASARNQTFLNILKNY